MIILDISRQASALKALHGSGLVLIFLASMMAISIGTELLQVDISEIWLRTCFLAFLLWAAFTSWRNIGTIDPNHWGGSKVVLPALLIIAVIGIIAHIDTGDYLILLNYAPAWAGAAALLLWISLFSLKKNEAQGMELTAEKILIELHKEEGDTPLDIKAIPRIHRLKGFILTTVGIIVIIVGAAVVEPFSLSFLVILFWGPFIFGRGRQYFQPDAEALLNIDHRSPILFLRSFDDDERHEQGSRSQGSFIDFSLELRLSSHFFRFGPFIAVRSPKDTVPQLGAVRVLLSNDEWQHTVLDWMRSAKIIVMYAGKTHWVNWELKKLIENGCVDRLILLIPEHRFWRSSARAKDTAERLEQIQSGFKDTPWEREFQQIGELAALRGILFDDDGSIIAIRSRSGSRDACHWAALIGHYILVRKTRKNATRPNRKPHLELPGRARMAAPGCR